MNIQLIMADLWLIYGRGEIPGFLFSRGEEGQFVFVRAEQFAARPRIHFGDLFMQ